jgi:hypothetical protein
LEFNRFDVSAKELIWDDPANWLERLSIGPRGPTVVIESDITALTAAADKVIHVEGPRPYLVNFEVQSSSQTDLVETTWFRQAALFHRHRLPVLTVLVLLRREANSAGLTGQFEIRLPDGLLANQYNYRVVRIWQDEPELYLTSGVNLVPMAPLTNVAESALPELVQRMADRINAEPEARAAMLWTATYLLMGLRFTNEFATQLLEGVQNMQESTTYQAILKEGLDKGLIEGRNEGLIEGRVSEAQRLLLMLGETRFGEADEAIRRSVEAILDLERLERLTRRVLDTKVQDWNGLLGTS